MPAPGHLSLVTSDRPAALIERLALDLGAAPLSPFDQETVVVQSQGMRRWLSHELARRHGCAAGLRMPFPAAFAHDLAASVDARPLDPRFARDAMAWRILALLEDGLADEPRFAALQPFAGRADTRKRLGLARRLAARFDDYLLYRPETLLAWERSEVVEPDVDETRWQAALWRRLTEGDGDAHHLARWLSGAVARLERGEVDAAVLPRRVSVFGVSTLPPCFVSLLRALARHVPVRAYLLAPAPAAWSRPANPLLAAFGHASRDLLASLAEGADAESLAPRIDGDSLLRRLQRDARDDVARGREPGMAPPLPLAPDDTSLTVHVCHSPMREMEVLRDQLLDAFAADATLRPHDVLVLVPDVATYAPFVEAVFGVGEPELPRIPFHLADRPVVQESSIADAALRLLRLVGARWTATEIVTLLDLPAVRRAAGVAPNAGRTVLAWVEGTRIRWGRDGATRKERFNLPDVDANTWRTGLDRLLMGYAAGRTESLVAGVLPHAGDTIGDPATLGALARWTDRLFDALDTLRDARPLAEWTTTLRALVDAFLCAEGEREERELAQLLGVIDGLESLGADAGVSRPTDLAVVRDWMENELAGDSLGSGFLVGGMTVCALKPMRAIPFRVIAVAGLDDDSFPRSGRGPRYDLLELDPRRGDRNVRADDRQLFLDALLSAGDRLILGYVGRSVTDNSERAASVVVAELLDAIDAGFDVAGTNGTGRPLKARDAIVVEHRLQPFSPAYYRGDAGARLFSYSRAGERALAASAARREAPFVAAPLPADDAAAPRAIALADLTDCWTNPSRWFCERVLGVRLPSEDEPLDDCEPMSVHHLVRYGLHDEMLRRHLRGTRDVEAERARALAVGDLPSGALAARWFDALDEELRDFLAGVQPLPAYDPHAIDVAGPDWTLVGRVDGLTDEGRRQVRAATCKNRDLVRAWIAHLALGAECGEVTSRVLATDGAWVLRPVERPLEVLHDLVDGFRAAQRAPLPVFDQASRAYVEQAAKLASGTSRASKPAIDAAADKYRGTGWGNGPSPDAEDPYVELCWRGRDPLADEATFGGWAERLWRPLLAHLEEVRS